MAYNPAYADAFAAATKSSGGDTFAGYIGDGKTVVMLVVDPNIDQTDESAMVATGGGIFAQAYDSFTDKATGKVQKRSKFIVLAAVVAADDPKGLTKGWDGKFAEANGDTAERAKAINAQRVVVPLAVSATMKDAILAALQANVAPIEVDPVTGAVTRDVSLPFTLLLQKSGKGLDTKYTAQSLLRVPAALKAEIDGLNTLLLPVGSIISIAKDYTDFRAERSDGAKVAAATPVPVPAPSVAPDSSLASLLDDL